jgi:hypothetical protein
MTSQTIKAYITTPGESPDIDFNNPRYHVLDKSLVACSASGWDPFQVVIARYEELAILSRYKVKIILRSQ